MKKHTKHSKLAKPQMGNYARLEWAIIGTPCGNIKQLSYALIEQLSSQYVLGYADADHKSHDEATFDPDSALSYGAAMVYTDKISHHNFEYNRSLEKSDFQNAGSDLSAALVNGNHFVAKSQIVVIDPKKEASLHKKLDRLTNVELILTVDDTPIYPFLKEHLEEELPPVYDIGEVDKIAGFIAQKIDASTPPLYGLVLAGGKSTRMGEDKGAIEYHGVSQREYAGQLLANVCDEVFLSCREDQLGTIDSAFELVPDTFLGLGPLGGILSAFRKHPNAAWLVIACDLPLLNKATLEQLKDGRNPHKYATVFKNEETGFPEPLISIWEPRIYGSALSFLAKGYACPRKVLINSPVELLKIQDVTAFENVNNPTEKEAIIEKLKKK